MSPLESACKLIPHTRTKLFFLCTSTNQSSSSRLVFVNYREDGMTPYFTFWKHGMNEMKV